MDQDPRRLIARLAVAVMVADGRIAPAEIDTIERLDALGLGPLSRLAGEEIQHAIDQPIDVPATCEGLTAASPEAAAVILAALAEVAASDQSVSVRELNTINTVARLLGLTPSAAAQIVNAAMAANGASLAGTPPGPSNAEPVLVIHHRPDEAPPPAAFVNPDLDRAYRVLGVGAGTSRVYLDAAYLRLIERYNPAKVEDLGAELTALAVRKLAEATAAFETVRDALDA
jgi:DnaJ-domain-containing protein 1